MSNRTKTISAIAVGIALALIAVFAAINYDKEENELIEEFLMPPRRVLQAPKCTIGDPGILIADWPKCRPYEQLARGKRSQ